MTNFYNGIKYKYNQDLPGVFLKIINLIIIMKLIKKLTTYIRESIAELKKVTWPTKKETTNYTLLVIGISLAVAAFIGIADYILSIAVEQVIK